MTRTHRETAKRRTPTSPARRGVLVVDDHAAVRESVIDVLRQAGYDVDGLGQRRRSAAAAWSGTTFDVVITDLQMPGMDGLEFIRQMSRRRLPTQVIMITAHATIASAVEAMRFGAFDYLEKPFDAARLEQLVARAMERRRLCAAMSCDDDGTDGVEAARRRTTRRSPTTWAWSATAPRCERLRERIRQVAPTDETVLICGESGTGKELVARAIHALSRRAAGRW